MGNNSGKQPLREDTGGIKTSEERVVAQFLSDAWRALQCDLDTFKEIIRVKRRLLTDRGEVGETLLHMALIQLYSKPPDQGVNLREIAVHLISTYPDMVNKVYESELYYGESALHIAVAHGDEEMTRLLLKHGARYDKEVRATGGFFKRGGQCYYGEYVLSFAACRGHKTLVDMFLDLGCSPNQRDSYGNTVMHLLVVHDAVDMFAYIQTRGGNMRIRNMDGLTPFTLSAKLGRKDLFVHQLEAKKQMVWSYATVTCVAYPLEELDTTRDAPSKSFLPVRAATQAELTPAEEETITNLNNEARGRNNSSGTQMVPLRPSHADLVGPRASYTRGKALCALEIIVQRGHLELLTLPLILRLLKERWSKYARRQFLQWLMVETFIVLLFTLSVVGGKEDEHDWILYLKHAIGAIAFGRLCWTIYIESRIYRNLRRQQLTENVFTYLKNDFWGYAFVLTWLFWLVIVLSEVFRLLDYTDGMVSAEAAAATIGWSSLMYFARGFRLTGPFVLIMYKIIVGDLLKFLSIYLLVLLGFSQAFYTLFRDQDIEGFETFLDSVVSTYRLAVYEVDYQPIRDSYYRTLSVVLFVVYGILVAVLLLNLLVAMLAHRFAQVTDNAEREWRLQWALIILDIEKNLSYDKYVETRLGAFNEEKNSWFLMVEEQRTEREDRILREEQRALEREARRAKEEATLVSRESLMKQLSRHESKKTQIKVL